MAPTLKVSDPAERVGAEGAWSTVSVNVAVADPAVLVALIVIARVPVVPVGLPEMVPAAGVMCRPEGSVPLLTL